jgi:uncharacterized protein (TIGR02145 family)
MKYIILLFLLFVTILTSYSQTSDTIQSDKDIGDANSETVTDIDGNVYQTIRIGSQIWMKENLRVRRYRNGDPIPTTNPLTLDVDVEGKIDKRGARYLSTPPGQLNLQLPVYQWAYNGDESIAAVYGRLYTWYAVGDSRNICPEGWHVSTDREWADLILFLGKDIVAGGKLKETGTGHWAEPNTAATNESGFTALGGGGRNVDGTFSNLKKYGAWWTSSPGVYRHIEHDDPYTYRNYYTNSKALGFSVRCVKD